MTLHLGGRDFDVLLDADQASAAAVGQQGVANSKVQTILLESGDFLVINWSQVPAFTVRDTVEP